LAVFTIKARIHEHFQAKMLGKPHEYCALMFEMLKRKAPGRGPWGKKLKRIAELGEENVFQG
jgi:hypothetical protein